MRFKRRPRTPYTITDRKRSAARRLQQRQRDALPLLAELVAEQQPGIDRLMDGRVKAWGITEQNTRDWHAQRWREARRILDAHDPETRRALLTYWNSHRWLPGDASYLLDMLDGFRRGRLIIIDDPSNPPALSSQLRRQLPLVGGGTRRARLARPVGLTPDLSFPRTVYDSATRRRDGLPALPNLSSAQERTMQCSSDDFDWNSDTVAQLTSLWAEGLSTAEIGRRIGVSKNAVIGKSHRLELQARPSPIRRDAARKPSVAPRPRCPSLAELQNWTVTASTPLPVRAVFAEVRRNPLQAAPLARIVREMIPVATAVLGTQSCCWPIGEPGTRSFRFCDAPNEAGKSYCPEHCRLAYRKKRTPPERGLIGAGANNETEDSR